MFEETPWGSPELILFGNRDRTFGMVWAERGHGLMIHEDSATSWDKQKGEKIGEYYWIEGMRER